MDRPLTVTRRTYAWPLVVADRVVAGLRSLGVDLGTLDEARLYADVERATGLHDFGDPAFREGMRQVLENADRLGFTPLARVVTRNLYKKALVNRLLLQRYVQQHPEVLDIPVERPIFVLGFPRTGTTTVQNLLCLHDDRRGLPFWELITPIPRVRHRGLDEAIRKAIARAILGIAFVVAPEQREVHDIRYDTLEECWYLFCNTFRVLNWDIQTGLETYGEWLFSTDMRPAYAEYRTWLQVMLHRRPARQLVVKCPEHLWFTDALLDVFPDACIVWTHRDPVSSVASYASMMALTRRLIYGGFEPLEMGPYITRRFAEGVERAMAVREQPARDARFHDVAFTDLVEDPGGVLRRIADHFDLDWPADHDARVRDWLASDRDDKAGSHVYSAEAFGVRPDEVYARFGAYIDRFRIPVRRRAA